MRTDSARVELQVVLMALGFASQQTVDLLAQGVTVEQLRGMLRLRQCEGVPAAVVTDLAARIDRLEQTEKLALDSLIA